MCKRVYLCIFICFLCLILGAFPSACLLCPILLGTKDCSFYYCPLEDRFLTKDRKGVNLGGEGAEEKLGGIEGGDSKIKI